MSHAHTPDHPPQTVEDLTRDIEAVEGAVDKVAASERLLKPTTDGLGPTLGVDLTTPFRG